MGKQMTNHSKVSRRVEAVRGAHLIHKFTLKDVNVLGHSDDCNVLEGYREEESGGGRPRTHLCADLVSGDLQRRVSKPRGGSSL